MKDNNNSNSKQWEEPEKEVFEDIQDDETDEFLREVRASLKEQVNDTMQDTVSEGEAGLRKESKKQTSHKIIKYVVLPLTLLMLLAAFMINTDMGRSLIVKLVSKYSYGKLNYVDTDKQDANTQAGSSAQQDPSADDTKTKPEEDKVSNILLIGMETFEGAKNTDTMIIASINSEKNTIKLTSLMRDLYVKIPGHDNAKMNSAYAKGGIDELYDTIETNFGVKMDGYILVDFSDFENVIDYIGGIDVTLTQKEANYLNTTNYISEPAYRNVVAGTQLMNGNQVLGYCRIRKVATETEHDDFGRTQRQRIVLEQIFEKLRSKNVVQLGLLMNKILDNIDIQTDISQTEYEGYLQQAVYLKDHSIQTLRIPTDDNYTNESYPGKYVKDVLVPKDWDRIREDIHTFIYGDTLQ